MKDYGILEHTADGLEIVHSFTEYSRPVLVIDRYRVISHQGDVPSHGSTMVLEAGRWWYGEASFGCEARPNRRDEVPVRPPKARGRKRWHFGRWQAYGKDGWQDAR